jgi:type I restriction enzyme M protein
MATNNPNGKSLESWIWDAACSIRGAKDAPKYSRIIIRDEIAKNDFNISPSRYINTGEVDEYRPIAEIVEELDALEAEAVTINITLREILRSFATEGWT